MRNLTAEEIELASGGTGGEGGNSGGGGSPAPTEGPINSGPVLTGGTPVPGSINWDHPLGL